MKVLGLSGSMRKEGNTADLVKVILERCQGTGIKTEFITLAGKKVHPCMGCEKCKEIKKCIIENDDWEKIINKVLDCDVLVIGKNEQVKKVFWTLFISMAGLVLTQVLDPTTAQQIVGLISGMGV